MSSLGITTLTTWSITSLVIIFLAVINWIYKWWNNFISNLKSNALDTYANQMTRKYDSSKLVSLYKFGEKDSPWELLTDQKLQQLKEELNSRVIGQEIAVVT